MGMNYKERFKTEKRYATKEEFIQAHYITCKSCGYNNEKNRLQRYGVCLNCGEPLDDKIYFMIKMQEKLQENRRKSR